jgi:hypothetical protein
MLNNWICYSNMGCVRPVTSLTAVIEWNGIYICFLEEVFLILYYFFFRDIFLNLIDLDKIASLNAFLDRFQGAHVAEKVRKFSGHGTLLLNYILHLVVVQVLRGKFLIEPYHRIPVNGRSRLIHRVVRNHLLDLKTK